MAAQWDLSHKQEQHKTLLGMQMFWIWLPGRSIFRLWTPLADSTLPQKMCVLDRSSRCTQWLSYSTALATSEYSLEELWPMEAGGLPPLLLYYPASLIMIWFPVLPSCFWVGAPWAIRPHQSIFTLVPCWPQSTSAFLFAPKEPTAPSTSFPFLWSSSFKTTSFSCLLSISSHRNVQGKQCFFSTEFVDPAQYLTQSRCWGGLVGGGCVDG